MKRWLAYFEHNRDHRAHIPWNLALNIEPHLLRSLIRSLQRFQVGESGEGRHLRAAAAKTGDTDYMRSIDLFIKEEQEHARMMSRVLTSLNAPLLTSHWTDNCFILLRRLFNINHELLVLLMPEMIAKRYFRAVHDGTSDPVVRAMCAQILHDEEGHVAFHIEFLQRAFASMALPTRMLARFVWRMFYRLACAVVILDHRSLLKAANVSPARFFWDCELIFDETAAAIFSSAPSHNVAAVVLARASLT